MKVGLLNWTFLKGVFEIEQTQKILNKGKNIGLNINFHADELYPLNSVEVRNDDWSMKSKSKISIIEASCRDESKGS